MRQNITLKGPESGECRMTKSTLVLAVVAMLAPGLSAAQTVQNFIIDPDPTLGQTEGAALRKGRRLVSAGAKIPHY